MPTNQHIRSIPPINSHVWAFSIGGLVRHPLILSYADLLRQPSVTLPVSVICTDERSIDSANYTGVPLSALFELVELREDVQSVSLHAYDGYTTVLNLDDLREQAYIAYALDGQPLTHEQGAPARLVIPGRYGYKLPKWITRLEATEAAQAGTWEQRGFDLDGKVKAVVEITHHETLADGRIRLHGFAYCPDEKLDMLEILVDRGLPTRFPLTGTYWHVDWTAPYPNGSFRFEAAVGTRQQGRLALACHDYLIRT